jgi:hypothetical protein
MTEIIDGKEFVKLKAKVEIHCVSAVDASIWVDKEDLLNSIQPKGKPIFCIGLPCNRERLQQVREVCVNLENDYYVLVFPTDSKISFRLFNSTNLEQADLETIKQYIDNITFKTMKFRILKEYDYSYQTFNYIPQKWHSFFGIGFWSGFNPYKIYGEPFITYTFRTMEEAELMIENYKKKLNLKTEIVKTIL